MANSENSCYTPKDSFPSSQTPSQEVVPVEKKSVSTLERFKVYSRLTKEELLDALTKRLLEHCSNPPIPKNPEEPVSPVLHRGIFSEAVLKYLIKNGMSEYSIMRAMKFGLRNLSITDLKHFEKYGVMPELMKSEKTWSKGIDDSLIEHLKSTGMNTEESLSILILGVIPQEDCYKYRLAIGGIDLPGILNWKGPTISASTDLTDFMRNLGIDEVIIETVTEKGIDEEAMEMLQDLGYAEYTGIEEITICKCKCKFPTLIKDIIDEDFEEISSKEMINENKTSEDSLTSTKDSTEDDVLKKKNYLRQNLMVPLTWALSETLKYCPTNPKHFFACQLLRWKYSTCPVSDLKEILNFVSTATKQTDDKLAAAHRIEEIRQLEKIRQEARKKFPCGICLEKFGLQRCLKCKKKLVRKYSTCDFPDDCSECKAKFSDFSISSENESFESKSTLEYNHENPFNL